MGLFDGIERLINEHGSATILKERIALANDKYGDLERNLKSAETDAAQLRVENQRLEAEVRSLRASSKPVDGGPDLSDEQIKALSFIVSRGNQESSAVQVAEAIGVSALRAQVHLDELLAAKFLADHLYYGLPSAGINSSVLYTSSDRGRKHLFKLGLI
jgi:hypothetical protein